MARSEVVEMHLFHPAMDPQLGGSPPDTNMVWIPGGNFLMGSDKHYPEEVPAHAATVAGFWIDKYAVTNEQFARFVDATGHVTSAERGQGSSYAGRDGASITAVH